MNPNIPEPYQPAFPFACQGPTTAPEIYYGITIRDYFAAMAMQALLSGYRIIPEETEADAIIAKEAYISADAMLAERNK